MTPQSPSWIEMVRKGAIELNLSLDMAQAEQFSKHAALLLEWNRKINLTAIVDPVEMAAKHYLDAIAPLNHIPPDGHLLDIGTGGGFPGIPLKIMRPRQPMTLIDGVRKKINFVKQAIRQLGLLDIQALQIRAEALGRSQSSRTTFNVIVCRALSDLEDLVALAGPLLVPGGRIVAYQGPAEPGAGARTESWPGYRLQSHSYRLPILGDPRTVTVLTKK